MKLIKQKGIILSLLKDNKEVDELKENDEGMIIVNQTPFYGESGGQVGDTGQIIAGETSSLKYQMYKKN